IFGVGGKAWRGADVAFEPTTELVTLYRFRNPHPRGGDPETAPRQLALEVGNHSAFGREDEADQLVDRPYLPADRAPPHRRGLVGPRPVVEFSVNDGKHARGISRLP